VAQVFMRLPVGIAGGAGGTRLECEGSTVQEALADCVTKEPLLRSRIFREDGTVWVGVFLNGKHVRQSGGLASSLADGDELRIMPPLGGG
jgi:molybdopterin synthase sulfur carrier subunit